MKTSNDYFVRVVDLCKNYPEGGSIRQVLQGINLNILESEFIAILGKSGSGKTTLLNLISGIDRVDCGEIYVRDIRLTSLNDHQRTIYRRKNIGFIFQFFNLIPTLTVWENITLPLELNGQNTPEDINRAERLLQEVGLLDRKNTYPDRLSGGEQQRVAIARALVHDPMIVLADEPTGNLDEGTGKNILDLLDRLTRKAGKVLIMVTHSQEAAHFADRYFTLRNGRFVDPSEA